MILLDLTHTSHTHARTGVQRVARALGKELGKEAMAVCLDPYSRAWRPLAAWEKDELAAEGAVKKRGASWPLHARLRGLLHRRSPASTFGGARGILVPEIFSPEVAAALPALFAAVPGPRAALFFDATPLKYPEFTPAKTVARYPGYMRELLMFDGIAAISEDARETLIEYWRWLGVARTPPVVAISLGVQTTGASPHAPLRGANEDPSPPIVLSVGSVEGRKNHLALLEACAGLWAEGARFELHVIGLPRPETAGAALRRIQELQAAGRPLRYDGFVDAAALKSAYAACAFTVYPSLMEGFGLPVGESLVRGKPCICSARGALGESARGGGCLMLETVDAESLGGAIGHLLSDRPALDRLAAAARGRKFKSEADYAREVKKWWSGLSPGRLPLDLPA